MGLKQDYKLKVSRVAVYTNLEVKLNSRTTKEEANKEVERILDSKNIFESYDWKIEGCPEGGINHFSEKLRDDIIERIGQEETEECIFWNGFKAIYELNIAHISVETDLEVQLKSQNVEEAIDEVNKLCAGKNLFEGYEWKISGCSEQGINAFDDQLQEAIIDRICQQGKIEDCIEEDSN
ncbi:MAG: hypothetical protein IIA63_11675 [Nitrospinae bacterium]|nr:hypothetical protein [Nitrospinota bacterium]